MKKIIKTVNIAIFSYIFISIISCASYSNIAQLKDRLENPQKNDVMVTAHRACWRYSPENSLKGIEECINMGVDMIEIDVRMSKDGHLIVIHDETVDRTTNGKGEVADLTLNELRKLKLRKTIR